MSKVDFGIHSDDYAKYRPGFPPSFYQRIDAIRRIKGTRALDLATGPGTVALELATFGSSVVGIDISRELLATAKRVATERNLDGKANFKVASAEDTGLDSDSFDLITAGQCWHWFDSATAMAEAKRVLRTDGVLVIAHYSYLAEHSPVAQDTEDLILQFNPSWPYAGQAGIYPELIDEVIHNGLQFVEQFCYQHDEKFSHSQWRGRMRTCNGVGSGGLSPFEVLRFDKDLGNLLLKKYPDPLHVAHRVWCVVARKPD